MKAPDKVYYTQTEHVANYFTTGKPFERDCVEYIRKDTLLEWAREKKERLGKMFDAMPATAIGAKLDACKEFIDKIKSL